MPRAVSRRLVAEFAALRGRFIAVPYSRPLRMQRRVAVAWALLPLLFKLLLKESFGTARALYAFCEHSDS